MSLSFLAASGFLALHALATPGVLLDKPNLGFVIATPVGLLLAAALAALSALDRELVPAEVARARAAGHAGAGRSRRWRSSPRRATRPCPDRLSLPLVALSLAGVALYAFAVVRYLALYRERRSRLLLGFTIAFVLLAEAMIAVGARRAPGRRRGGSGTC